MADIIECVEKLVMTGKIGRALADEALDFYKRRKAEWSASLGPASAEASAALETAEKMRNTAKDQQNAIASTIRAYRDAERRTLEDPRGTNAAVAGMLSKDTRIGDNKLKQLMKDQPDHPIFRGGNIDFKHRRIAKQLYSMLGNEIDKFKTGLFGSDAIIKRSKSVIDELFGVNTGDKVASTVAKAFNDMNAFGTDLAIQAGKVFQPREDWRIFQHWTPRRVAKVSEDEYVKIYREKVDSGAIKLWDKETNRYAASERYDDILKKAYSDIKTEGGTTAPFSKDMRTFEFQPGQAGADAWWELQQKFGVGNEVMSSMMQHIDKMAGTIALHQQFGGHPDAVFAALMRLVKNNPSKLAPGLGWLDSENTLRNTYNVVSGKGHPIVSEITARIMSGARDLVGVASLRNLPLTIAPSDTLITFLSSNFNGMSGLDVIKHTFDSNMTADVARHLQIATHGYIDFMNNSVRRYEDEINVSGLVRKFSRNVVKATGADWWTRNIRQGSNVSYVNTLTSMRDLPFEKLNTDTREHFMKYYGFTPTDWDKIRSTELFDPGNGAKYFDLPKMEPKLADRLAMAIDEQSSYGAHQPDARTQAIISGGVKRGTMAGEAWLSAGQYKQFALERMTTHLTRMLVDGPWENRVMRGLAFTVLSTAAGAISIQAAQVIGGKDPRNMAQPDFWIRAFARGGAGGVYGDVLGAAFEGGRGYRDLAAQMAGPIPGLASDILRLPGGAAKSLMDEKGKPVGDVFAHDAFATGRRWSPNTWYTKLAVDRLLWDKLQILADPNYRASFRRAEQAARKQGAGFWWGPGDDMPTRAPQLGTAIGGQ